MPGTKVSEKRLSKEFYTQVSRMIYKACLCIVTDNGGGVGSAVAVSSKPATRKFSGYTQLSRKSASRRRIVA